MYNKNDLQKSYYPVKAYQVFKYLVYFYVLVNVFLFLQKDLKSSVHRFGEGISVFQIFEVFTATLDTAAWVILLLLFELQTYILPKEKITKHLNWLFISLRTICFLMVFSSFVGYVKNYNWLNLFQEKASIELCEEVGQSWMKELDEFLTIEKDQCKSLAKGTVIYKHSTKSIFTDDLYLKETRWLAIIDLLNSLSWILVVLLLEMDIWLIRKQTLKKTIYLNHYLKNGCYFLLLFCAVYWGIYGDFLEFWDAFLWIVAFVFIELNILKWG